MFENFAHQIRENDRLRWGVLLAMGIFWLYLVLLLKESSQESVGQYRATSLAIHRLQEQLVQPEWRDRLDAARTMSVQMEGRLWQAATPGLAQAALQDWLNAISVKAGVSHPRLLVAIAGDTPAAPAQTNVPAKDSDLWKINAKVSFDLTPASLLAFLEQVESHDKQVDISSLQVRRQPAARVDIELYAYFQSPAPRARRQEKELVPL